MRAHRRIEMERRARSGADAQREAIRSLLHERGWMLTSDIAAELPWSVRTVGDRLESMLARHEVLSLGGLADGERIWRMRRLPEVYR